MNKLKLFTTSALAAGMLLTATPALADHTGSSGNGSGGMHFGGFFDLPIAMHVGANVGAYKNDDKSTSTATTSFKKALGNDFEIGVVGSVNGSNITLDPAINLSGTSTAATNVVINASTTFKGGASSTANLTAGEKVLIVGTTSTSTPGTITASIVIAIQNAWHFCTHMFSK
jgi:hypothetical protein